MMIKNATPLLSNNLFRLLATVITINLSVFSGQVQSASVFSQSPLDGADGPASFYEEHSADDFSLTANTSITGIQWWGSFFDDSVSNNTFDISFFNDNGGLPSSSSFEQFTVNASRSSTGLFDLFGGDVFLFDVALTPFNLMSNTPYYVSIVHPEDAIDDEFYWLQSDDTGVNFTRNVAVGPAWEANQGIPGNLAFSLQGNQVATVPEPATFLLLATSLFGFAYKRHQLIKI